MKKKILKSRIYAEHCEGVLEKITSKMSYRDILKNVRMVKKEAADFLPDDLASLTITAYPPLLEGEVFLFFLDISTILENKPSEYMYPIIPMYRFLLESYDVTVEQFLEDFYLQTVEEVISEMIEEKSTEKKGQ